jgi:hypothetical protein
MSPRAGTRRIPVNSVYRQCYLERQTTEMYPRIEIDQSVVCCAEQPNVAVEWVAFLLRIKEVPLSNLVTLSLSQYAEV